MGDELVVAISPRLYKWAAVFDSRTMTFRANLVCLALLTIVASGCAESQTKRSITIKDEDERPSTGQRLLENVASHASDPAPDREVGAAPSVDGHTNDPETDDGSRYTDSSVPQGIGSISLAWKTLEQNPETAGLEAECWDDDPPSTSRSYYFCELSGGSKYTVHVTPKGYRNYLTYEWDGRPDRSAFDIAQVDVTDTAGGFCAAHSCIPNFDEGNGSIAMCADGQYSQSGGVQGACSHHGGLASNSTGGSGINSTSGSTWVDGYFRADGTYVSGYWRGGSSGSSYNSGSYGGGSTWVNGYTRSDGTYVSGHWRG